MFCNLLSFVSFKRKSIKSGYVSKDIQIRIHQEFITLNLKYPFSLRNFLLPLVKGLYVSYLVNTINKHIRPRHLSDIIKDHIRSDLNLSKSILSFFNR